ncbi:hypothetical protein AMJ85_03265 [candidate division BRC1 bacterium SM23_51]|nr:MAG: hypothetical protein AMJ85_03265 [candidate division BRC1 bacterium SM23_51]
MTEDRPKGLLDVGGRSIVDHQVTCLRGAGISEIAMVIGHGGEKVREQCGERVTYLRNERYRETNSLYSAWVAREFGREGCLILNSDVLFHPALVERLLSAPHVDCLLMDSSSRLGEEEMKVILAEDGRIRRISKDLEPVTGDGENVGVVRLGREGARRFFEFADEMVRRREWNHWVPFAIDSLCETHPFFAVLTGGLPWIEIDYLHDLRAAREKVFPKIHEALKELELDGSG